MDDRKFFLIALVIILVVALSLCTINFKENISDTKNHQTISLGEVEIREYEGEDLSSINDFRENSIKGIQYIDINNYTLNINGLVEEEKQYTYDEVINRQSYSKVITLHCVEGWSATILLEGTILRELLAESKPLPSANTIIFHAYDGYSTSYPIEYIMDQDVLIAYKMNNATIIPSRGFPFQLIAEDKWGYKWIKWIIAIEFSDDPNYRGYWESRGYSNDGSLDGSFRRN